MRKIALRTFELPRDRPQPPVQEDNTDSEAYNESENTIFNELIHGTTGASAHTIPRPFRGSRQLKLSQTQLLASSTWTTPQLLQVEPPNQLLRMKFPNKLPRAAINAQLLKGKLPERLPRLPYSP